MSNPAPTSVLRTVEAVRRLSAIALWFAALFGRILPGAARRREAAEVWRYIEATMTQFADLLERLAAGEVPPEAPARSKPRRQSRPDSVTPRTTARAPRAPRASTPQREVAPKRPPRAHFPIPAASEAPQSIRAWPAKPKITKLRHRSSRRSHAYFVAISQQNPITRHTQTDKSFRSYCVAC